MMMYLDKSPNIVKWSYEPTCIKYYDKVQGKVRRYFIDFSATIKVGNIYKRFWLEVKPYEETVPPKNKSSKNQQTYITNQCKWESAKQIAESKGCTFQVVTEKQLV